jgi:hypothetical protein
MRTTDNTMFYKRGVLFVPTNQMVGGSVANGAVPYLNFCITSRSYDCAQWGTVGANTGMVSGAKLEGIIPIPKYFNPNWPLGFRLHWLATPAAGSTVWSTFVMLAAFKKTGEVMATAAAGALDTVIPIQSLSTGAYYYNKTGRGIKNGNWATVQQVLDGMFMEVSFACTVGAGINLASQGVWLLGMDIDYVPMLTRQPHSTHDAPEGNDVP